MIFYDMSQYKLFHKKLLFFVPILLFFISLSCEKKETYPVAGTEPVTNIGLLEDHSEALARWAEMGISNAVVVNIDAHDDTRWIQGEKIEKLLSLYKSKDWASIKESRRWGDNKLYNAGNFLYASAKIGIISEIYWVIPFAHFSVPDTEQRLRVFLKSFSFLDKEIQTFRMADRCFRGNFNGVRLSLCGIETLPEIKRPVILSVDTDFFPPMAFDYGVNKLDALRILFEKLFRKKYTVLDAVVSYSVDGGYTRVIHRWIGDQAAEILRNPAIIYQDNPPALWSIRQNMETLYRKASLEENLGYIMPLLEKYSDKPSLLTYASHILYETGSIDKMYRYAEKACEIDRNYCHGLIEIGQNLLENSKFNEAERFFRQGYSLNPEMNYRQRVFGIALMKEGRYKEALEFFKISRERNGTLPDAFYMGEAFLNLGNKPSALRHFDSARKVVTATRYIDTGKKNHTEVIIKAIEFYKINGYDKEADELANNPELRELLTKEPKSNPGAFK